MGNEMRNIIFQQKNKKKQGKNRKNIGKTQNKTGDKKHRKLQDIQKQYKISARQYFHETRFWEILKNGNKNENKVYSNVAKRRFVREQKQGLSAGLVRDEERMEHEEHSEKTYT